MWLSAFVDLISSVTPILLLSSGLYFTCKLKFFYLRHPLTVIKSMCKREKKDGISPFRAVTLALAGTLGVGNIAGVASSIALGGYGSVLWMWVSALLAMVLKYAEIVLAIAHRRRGEDGEYHGGASYYIYDHFAAKGKKVFGRLLAMLFAVLCILNAVTMGCMIQSNAVSTSCEGVLRLSPAVVGAVVAILCVIVISGNAKWISGFSEKTIPPLTLGYIVLSLAVLIMKRDFLGEAFALIFRDAFTLQSAVGGSLGFLISRGMKAGVMRGLMSNEAGCGTAPTAHASADTDSPAKQGFWGIFEVFVDTILLCTLTALVIIVATMQGGNDLLTLYADNPMMLAIKSYSAILGNWSEYFMTLSVFLFAFATMVCWAHYGKESLLYLTKRKFATPLYIILYALFLFFGALSAPSLAWLLADLALGIMTVINLMVLFAMRKEVKHETELFFAAQSYKPRARDAIEK